MTIVDQPRSGLDYYPCRYGRSRVSFRGPRRRLDRPFVAVWGSTATYGRYIREPFVAHTERALGRACINFGVVNGGLDVFLNDPEVLMAAERAETVVIEAMGAQNMSNRFYTVHPRRNDRFVKASRLVRMLYPEIDFTEYNFTGHLLGDLVRTCPERFEEVTLELQAAWTARMKHICSLLPGKVVLLWFANRLPDETRQLEEGPVPSFVTRGMINTVRPHLAGYAEVVASKLAQSQGVRGMVVPEMEQGSAARLLGPRAHEEAARTLATTIRGLRK